MKYFRTGLLLAAAALVSACAQTGTTTRNAPFQEAGLPFAEASAPVGAYNTDVRVENITVRVPRTLRVSEGNGYLPSTDIVWRGDPMGDRHAQIGAIFYDAMNKGTEPLNGATPVFMDIEVTRFHALTERARYTTGGVHNINFILSLRHAKTGAPLGEPRRVRADIHAFGGRQALEAEARGETQKVRITNLLAEAIRQELTTPSGFQNPKLGLIQALNQL
ncbi:DUF6778 family protein [uncultured Tateyamaria sp.]|uniref:DUF6778 family protein n=1 Tax=uncultured Tateyamaria sp. TaxID=455651 RepID=UPI0026043426|nr:DUF6778 family protein [uncultured Tateyamaria sp.]